MLNVETKLTYADYLETSDDERYELLNGELILSPSPKEIHQFIAGILYFRIVAIVRERRLGKVYFSPFDVVLSDTNVVQPDILFISNERADIITSDNVQGAPDLVVEILSPCNSRARLDGQVGPVRHTRRERVLDRGSRRQDDSRCCCGGRAGSGWWESMVRGRRCVHRRWRGSGWRWRRFSDLLRRASIHQDFTLTRMGDFPLISNRSWRDLTSWDN